MKFLLQTFLMSLVPISTVFCAPLSVNRQPKNLAFFDYVQPDLEYTGYDQNGYDHNDYVSMEIDENELSRSVPTTRKRVRPQYNSPIYYIRLPPQPYVFVPGLGYVSQPAPSPMSQFVNLPVSFVANGKPSSIYQWNGALDIPTVAPAVQTTMQPKPLKPKPAKKPLLPDSNIHRLPGSFTFNGKPDEIYVLRDSYNALYSDVLQNLYP